MSELAENVPLLLLFHLLEPFGFKGIEVEISQEWSTICSHGYSEGLSVDLIAHGDVDVVDQKVDHFELCLESSMLHQQ